ncbi:MAG: arylsulfatase [Gemmataceae bacterium]
MFPVLAALALAAPPAVVLIVADDLGYGELGCYGQKKVRTPSLDRMAKEGTRFTRFYSGSPVCAPSRCCLMTGKHGGHAWVRDNREAKPEGQSPLPASEVTLAELLHRQGFATAGVGKWGLGPPGSSGDPLKRGFDHFFGYNCQRHAHSHYPTWVYRDAERVKLDNDGKVGRQHTQDLFEAEALKYLDANRDQPFFLYLPFTVPHVALQADDAWLAEYAAQKWDDPPYKGGKGYLPHPTPRAAYAAMITRMDRTVGKVVEKLKELKRDRDTLVLFTSDNGATHDAGGADTVFFDSVAGLRGRKGSVFEGGIRVPLIAWQPGKVKAGAVTDHAAYFPDVLPTALEWVGKASATPAGLDGLSFAAALRGERQTPHEYMLWEFPGYGGQQAVIQGRWKGLKRDMNKGPAKLQLYDLTADPNEEKDVAADHPDVVKKLEAVLKEKRSPSKLFPIKGLE